MNAAVSLPLYSGPVNCGFISPAEDYIENFLSLDEKLVKNPASTFFVRASGHSMKPTIWDGDLLVVDRSLETRYGKVILGCLDGEFVCKRIFKEHQQLILRSDNKSFPDMVLGAERDFTVWGTVIHIVHSV